MVAHDVACGCVHYYYCYNYYAFAFLTWCLPLFLFSTVSPFVRSITSKDLFSFFF
jgi:hypothetical protein